MIAARTSRAAGLRAQAVSKSRPVRLGAGGRGTVPGQVGARSGNPDGARIFTSRRP